MGQREAMKFTRPRVGAGLAIPAITAATPDAVAPFYSNAELAALEKTPGNLVVINESSKLAERGTRRVFDFCGVGLEDQTVKGEVYGLRPSSRDGVDGVEPMYVGLATGTLGANAFARTTAAGETEYAYCKKIELSGTGALAALLGGQADATASGETTDPAFFVVYGVSAFRGFVIAPYVGTAEGVDVRDGLVG
ncbi:MAG: hypothetical protein ACREJO_13825 [Phycisphaerales bacterium]